MKNFFSRLFKLHQIYKIFRENNLPLKCPSCGGNVIGAEFGIDTNSQRVFKYVHLQLCDTPPYSCRWRSWEWK